jgi:hypothetical protein
MKHCYISLLFLAIGVKGIAQVTWSTPVTVTTGAAFGNLHPRVTLNRSGNPLVLWGKSDTKAYFSRWNGTAFTAPIVVGNTTINVFAQSWAGPDIASYGDTVYVTMKRTPETMSMNHMYMAHSYDGGMTFSDTVKIDNIGTNMSRFPIVTTTSTGNPIVAFMKFSPTFTTARYVVTRSTDYGMTFSPEVVASGSADSVCDCCPASIISAGSNVIMLSRENIGNIRDMWAGVSTDGGMTFPGHMAVDTTNWMIMSCPSSGPDGFVIGDSIYTVFMSTSTGTALVHLSRASISGMTAKHKAITGMFTGLSSQNYPRIANAGNAAVAVWKQNTASGNSIVYSFTNNISSGLPTYTVVPTATGSGMINADVTMTPGAIHIVWEDDNSGSVMYAKGTYTVPSTSIEPLVKKELIEVYPNPANESFTVYLGNVSNISSCFLTDNVGRNIELKPIIKSGKAVFSLNGIAKGGYYFVMTDEVGKTYYSKLIVQ